MIPQEELEVMDLLVAAHNKFLELPRVHQMELQEWIASFHGLQNILGHRILSRDYPLIFNSFEKKDNK